MKKEVFGYELIMDLRECDKKIITSKAKLKEYVGKLCKVIKMEKYSKVMLPYFGSKAKHTEGYSLAQFIETSSITGHFSSFWNIAYLNIFSCRSFNKKIAGNFTKKFFKAKTMKTRFFVR